MSNEREGQVVTFYSFKGGTGRTMALANVAWILAANGKRVLVADWDLESPGLHRFFHPFLDVEALRGTGGVIDLIREYETETTRVADRPEDWVEQYARVGRYAFSLRWDFPGGGGLDFLAAGRQNPDYAVSVRALDWDTFYSRLGGERFFEALRADMKRHYDYVLIDSRTGLSDVADICTLHLPDTLVDCFTLSDQGIDGAARVAQAVRNQRGRREIRVLPVPMRVDQGEKEKAEAGRALAMRRFTDLPSGLTESERRRYWAAVEVPYRPFYAYEETLATFGDASGSPTSLLAAFETLTGVLTEGAVTEFPPMEESVREREKARFRRRFELPDDQIVLRYAPEDAVWAEWIERVLASAGVRVVDGPSSAGPPARTLTVASSAYLAIPARALPPRDPAANSSPLAVYVGDLRPLAEFPILASTHLVNVTPARAAERLLRLVGRPVPLITDGPPAGGVRFPGTEPVIFNAPNRNARFTGREGDLADLRRRLQSGTSAAMLPVVLQGMPGVGKTQLAIEYVHRFRSAYDVVWWVEAAQSRSREVSLAELADRLGVGGAPTMSEDVLAVQQALGRGQPYERWLLVFDDAEEADQVARLLPQGTGHVLLTSRNPAWGDRAYPLQVDVFARAESVAHLVRRVPSMTEEEADRVAEALGDLAVAVSVAGAWLAETGTSVPEYLRAIERHASSALSAETIWDLSLHRLRERAPAAYRLLQLCSVLAPEIALDMLYSDEMADALAPFDPAVSERLVRGALVQQINRLALIRIDVPGGRVLVHRLLQAAVRDGMTAEEAAGARHQVHLVLAASRPRGEVDDPETWARFDMLWPHLEVSGAVNCREESVRQLLIDRVRYLWRQGELARAEEFSQWVEGVWSARLSRIYGPDEVAKLRRQLLHLRFNHANVLRDLARFTEARALDERVLGEQRGLLGDRHPHTLMTAGSLAADLRALGRYAEAIERDELTYAAWAEVLGEDHPRTLNAALNLAHSYRLLGDFRSARQRDEEVHQRRRVVHGPANPFTLHTAAHLGRDLREAGEYDKSVVLLRTVHDTLQHELGSEAVLTLNTQVSLGVSLRVAGLVGEAAPLLDTAYRILDEQFGPDNPETLICRAGRAANLLALGETGRGAAEAAAVAQAYESSLGPRHPHTLAALSNVAVAERSAGRAAEARKAAARSASALQEVLGPEHPHTLAAEENLAILLAEEGQRDQASQQLRQAAARWSATSGPHHPDTLRCQANVALVGQGHEGKAPSPGDLLPLDLLAEVVAADHPTVQALRKGRLVPRMIDPHPF
ncbi:tetratricopeptide repeat protein [Micromonospora sp. U56]|uniref:FxSxx-COOH system tetratricopeptide repeat protein n=1 Tax=Micromonospora sp. U56 TaxID=2824900 RepID=UPI001B39A77B|nr:FxSxx-COOH system tetratricopeptide repeat protein [Micromonospora sp. U56]MBQ0897073.1 tetratricopeptide repeat protein [Micromonospora sp. U56]